MNTYPQDKLFEEMAFLAYHFHWSYYEILNLEHSERINWCNKISEINKKINQQLGN